MHPKYKRNATIPPALPLLHTHTHTHIRHLQMIK